jgi:predicted RNA-binding Zn ribbon-like protein
MDLWQPELVGGHPALDFVNSLNDWTVAHPRDYLAQPQDALRFGRAAGLLSATEAHELAPAMDVAELESLRRLRACLQRVLHAAVHSVAPDPEDLRTLSEAHAASARAATLCTSGAGGALTCQVPADLAGASTLRHRIVQSAVELLTSADTARLKSCPSCGWFFLDTSRNRSRRWCSMATCGNVAKARRYYERRKD